MILLIEICFLSIPFFFRSRERCGGPGDRPSAERGVSETGGFSGSDQGRDFSPQKLCLINYYLTITTDFVFSVPFFIR
jgi:hypothetical protein